MTGHGLCPPENGISKLFLIMENMTNQAQSRMTLVNGCAARTRFHPSVPDLKYAVIVYAGVY